MKKFFLVSVLLVFLNSFLFSQQFLKGADLSSLQQYEDLGVKFFDENKNQISDVINFFADKNLDCVRFRIWVNPELAQENSSKTDYCNLENTIKIAKRVKYLGMKVLIDFHYSDYWADPSQQTIPKKWKDEIFKTNFAQAQNDIDLLQTTVSKIAPRAEKLRDMDFGEDQ